MTGDGTGIGLVRLGPPSKGDRIHKATCRHAKKHPNALPWKWAEDKNWDEWACIPWFHYCDVCKPDLPPVPRRVED